MNDYHFDDLAIGMKEQFKITITEVMMNEFRQITGDVNPLHTDIHFAMGRNYPDRVVYGMLTASFISTLGGVYLPGRLCLIQSVESKFVHPVYIGDMLTIVGTVVELNETVRQVKIKVVMTNQNDEKVLRGTLKAGFLDG